jgi:anhydro-N-acetylmuramic acid kinase
MTNRPTKHDALLPVRGYRELDEHLLVGLMTGTSADAVDAVLVRLQGSGLETRHEIVSYRETALEPALRREVLEVAAVRELAPERLMRLDAALGERFAAAVLELLAGASVDRDRVTAIGSHGQTVRHVPRRLSAHGPGATEGALTLQLGSASLLAERTGITVVSDFRTRDTAAGGEGAPLVPLADWWLFRSTSQARVLLNLGGMANLTWLPRAGGLGDVLAFDTGPGNAVLDALASLRSGGRDTHDVDGSIAAGGRASEAVLSELLEDPFFALPPPRSTGREHFGDAYAVKLRDLGLSLGMREEDVMATAVELTAASVAGALQRFVVPRGVPDVVYVSGGGVRNRTLMRAIEARVGGVSIQPLAVLGVPAEAKEALAFAFLAHQTLCGLAGNVPSATGAGRAVVLGHITPGALR